MISTQQISENEQIFSFSELTGGPGTECDTCPDYTYEDVVNKHWPAAVGGVLKLTGKTEAAYVGHSNGGRVALDSMKNYTNVRNVQSYLSDGTPFTLNSINPSNPIINYIGVGVPGAFATSTIFTRDVDEGKGDRVVNEFIAEGKTHVRLAEVGAKLETFGGWLARMIAKNDEQKISRSILERYITIANSTSDTQPGTSISLPKFTLIYGTLFDEKTSDGIVPKADAIAISTNVASIDEQLIETSTLHSSQKEDREIKTTIKKRLNE